MNRLVLFVVVRITLAVALTVLVISLKWEYVQWGHYTARFMNTPVFLFLHLLIAVLVFSALAQPARELYRHRLMPFQSSLERLGRLMKSVFAKLAPQMLLWGFMVVIAVCAAWKYNLLNDENFKFNAIVLPWMQAKQEETNVRILPFLSRDNNQEAYLQNCLKIVRDLKAAGAKVVMVPLPFFVQPGKTERLAKEIHNTGIAVLGMTNRSSASLLDSRLRTGLLPWNPIIREYPFRVSSIQQVALFPQGRTGTGSEYHDVAFEVLKKYFDLPDDQQFEMKGSEIVIGNRRFASDRQGNVFLGRWGYSNFGTNIVAGDVLDVLGGKADRAPSLYYVQLLPEGQGKKKKDLMDHRNLFSGKIVILQVQDLGGIYPSAYQWIGREYAQILDNITKGYILTRSWAYTLAAIVIGVAVTGVILARGKPLPATGFLTLLWGIEIYVPGWLFQCHGILVDAPPIFASLIASFVVFVIVRLGHEWKTSLLPSPSYHKTKT